MKLALDTNVLVYAEGVNGTDQQDRAAELMVALSGADRIIPVQALAELFNVLTRKAGWSASDALMQVMKWRDFAEPVETSETVLDAALHLSSIHKLRIWDALILAAAAEAGCRLLLSEDMQDGFTWRGVTVVNPFAEPRSPLLEEVLRG